MAAVRRSLLNPKAPEYIPISHTNNSTVFHFYTPLPPPPPPTLLPLPPPPPPPPTVVSLPREDLRRPSIPPRLVPPRFWRNGLAARRGGRGFSRASNGNRGGFGRPENEYRRGGVCYGKWPVNNRLKKHAVIPLSWSHKNNTTVMIKNIPYGYNREMLMGFLDQHCLLENQKGRDSKGETIPFAYDFLYLPMDFKNKRSKGYAFVNFTDHRSVWKFFWAFDDKLNVFGGSSSRRVKIVSAKIQGKEALVDRFKQTRFECESEGFLPVWFNPARDGSGEMVQMITVGKCRSTDPSCSNILDK